MRETESSKNPGISWSTPPLVVVACLVVIFAGIRVAAPILVPFLLAAFLAILCAPPLAMLRQKGIPSFVAVPFVILLATACGLSIALLLGTSVHEFLQGIPAYQEQLTAQMNLLFERLGGAGFEEAEQAFGDTLDPANLMRFIANTLVEVSSLLTNALFIVLTAVFILLEGAGLPQKLAAAFPRSPDIMEQIQEIMNNVNRYLAIKTILSLVTGFVIWGWLVLLGVDYALLWGVLAFLLNFIPNIGSIIAAVPACMLAWIQFGFGWGLIVASGYVLVNIVVGNLLEPRITGQTMGLSTLVVFLSLVFWAWLLGPIGMLLSVPLTMIAKIALENSERTRWVAILLATTPPQDADPSG